VGATLDLHILFMPDLMSDILFPAMKILFLMFLIRGLSAYVFTFIFTKREALLTALALSMPLTLMIAVVTVGVDNHMIGEFDRYAVILASLIEVIVAMIAIKALVK